MSINYRIPTKNCNSKIVQVESFESSVERNEVD